MDVIVQIDMDKFDIFKKAHELDASPYHPLVCLSEELGLFYADFFDNKAGVDLLEQVIDFASDCIGHGVKAISLGGGEPFEYDGVFDVIDALYPKCYLSVTSNGLPLENEQI